MREGTNSVALRRLAWSLALGLVACAQGAPHKEANSASDSGLDSGSPDTGNSPSGSGGRRYQTDGGSGGSHADAGSMSGRQWRARQRRNRR